MQPAIVAEGLKKRFGRVEAVRGVSFEVRPGEIFAFLGPNGAGKTTTVHMLTTLLRPSAGRAEVAGFDVVASPTEVRRRIGVVFQDPSLDRELTARENLYIHGRIYGLGGPALREKIGEVLRLVELEPVADRPVKQFSGGMKRRLELARALVHRPRVLFLDEPTLGLDPQTRAHVWDYIRAMKAEAGLTLFLTTHYMDEAEALADRVAIIDRGEIIALGTVEELIRRIGGELLYLRPEGKGRCRPLPGVRNCRELPDGRLLLEVEDAASALPRVLEALLAGGQRVREVTLRRPTLNDVFIRLTGRELRDELTRPGPAGWRGRR